MIRYAGRAALLRRDAYLRMVLAPDGVADGAIVVAAVHGDDGRLYIAQVFATVEASAPPPAPATAATASSHQPAVSAPYQLTAYPAATIVSSVAAACMRR